MKKIPLTKGQFALVDDDYETPHKWHAKTSNATFYARRTVLRPRKRTVAMHREIMGVTDPQIEVDHIDGNGLNNQRSNLRLATSSQNKRNRGKPSNNTSGYKGVTWFDAKQRWKAQICLHGKVKHLGLFDDVEDAAQAYDDAVVELHGEFARLSRWMPESTNAEHPELREIA